MPRHFQCCRCTTWCVCKVVRRPTTVDAFWTDIQCDTIQRDTGYTRRECVCISLVLVKDLTISSMAIIGFSFLFLVDLAVFKLSVTKHFINLLYKAAVCWCECSSNGCLAMFDLLTIVYISAIFLLLHSDIFSICCAFRSVALTAVYTPSLFNFVSHNLLTCSSFYVQHICAGFSQYSLIYLTFVWSDCVLSSRYIYRTASHVFYGHDRR